MIGVVARRHWGIARWLGPSSVLQWMSLNLFMVFAPVYYGSGAAGALRACQNIVAIAHIWFLGLENVVPAEAARQVHEHGIAALNRYIRKTLLKWGFLTIAFMAVISVAPSFWLHLLYGARYAQFGYVLRLYALLYVMNFVGGPLRAGLQAIEFTAPILWSYAVVAISAAVLGAPLAKQLGLLGVMMGLIITQVLFWAILAAALLVRTKRMRRQEISIVEGELEFEGNGGV